MRPGRHLLMVVCYLDTHRAPAVAAAPAPMGASKTVASFAQVALMGVGNMCVKSAQLSGISANFWMQQ